MVFLAFTKLGLTGLLSNNSTKEPSKRKFSRMNAFSFNSSETWTQVFVLSFKYLLNFEINTCAKFDWRSSSQSATNIFFPFNFFLSPHQQSKIEIEKGKKNPPFLRPLCLFSLARFPDKVSVVQFREQLSLSIAHRFYLPYYNDTKMYMR